MFVEQTALNLIRKLLNIKIARMPVALTVYFILQRGGEMTYDVPG